MRVMVVDNNFFRLHGLIRKIKKFIPLGAEIKGFRRLSEAQKYAQEHSVDVAFIDMEMQQSYGLLLAMKLKEINPRVNLIFVSDTYDYGLSAFEMHVSDYMIKPIKAEWLGRSLANLRYAFTE